MRHYHKSYSPALGFDMECLIFGWSGAPVLVFPTSKGRFFQWEDFGMIRALGEHLSKGWLQLFCVDSVDHLSWYNFDDHQTVQLAWHSAYEEYLTEEFLPWVRSINPTPYLIATGASFGGFHAVNFGLRYPELVNRVVAMSGDYEAGKYVEGYFDEEVYHNSPLHWLADCPWEDLDPATRQVEFRLLTGRHDFCLPSTEVLAYHLRRLGVPTQYHIWDHPGHHDWPLWKAQAPKYL